MISWLGGVSPGQKIISALWCADNSIQLRYLISSLAAILVADIAGYSRLMAEDEAATVTAIKGHQVVVLPLVAAHGGRIQDTAGDGILAEFRSVQQAVECALAIQRTMAERNAAVPPARQMRFRIGVNHGDVMSDGARVYGDGLNIAARIQALAEPVGVG